MRRIFPFLLLLTAAAIAACGGGGSSTSAVPPTGGKQGSGMASAGIKIFVPSAKSAGVKHAQYIVPGTQSVRIHVYTVAGVTPSPALPDTIAQIGPTAPGCSQLDTGVSCTIVVSVPINPSVVLEISSYASTDGTGTALADGFVSIDTTQPNITPPPVALGGVIGSLIANPTATSPPVATTGIQTFTFTITAKDANGNIILPPGTFSPSVFFSASNDPNKAISFSPNPLVNPDKSGVNTITMSFDPSKGFAGSATITATASVASGPVTASLTFSPVGSGGGGLTIGHRVFEYAIPSGSTSKPWQITVGPDGSSLWFTENGAEKFAAIFPSTCTQTATPACTILEGSLPQTNGATMPTGIVAGPNGLVWIGGTNSVPTGHLWTVQSGACSTSTQTSLAGCTTTQQPDPMNSPSYYDIKNTTGNVLEAAATSNGAGGIVQIAPLAQPTPFFYHQSGGSKSAFGVASDGLATDPGGNILQLGCSDCGSLQTYPFSGSPQGIVNLSNGYLFVADATNSDIAYANTTTCFPNGCGSLTFTPVNTLTAGAQPEFLTIGPDGNIWFTEFAANKIGVLNTTTFTMIAEIPIPTANAGPWGITTGPDGNIWFTEYNTGKIGVVVP